LGGIHVARALWEELGIAKTLQRLTVKEKRRAPHETAIFAMVANRLIRPRSEHAMIPWFDQLVATEDVLGLSPELLNDDLLYRQLDRLHPLRENIETALARREESLFNLDQSIFLYDLTSTYFEGLAAANPKAKRGYSRDHRPDCKQVVIGLALRSEGFPVGHEVFAGNQHDGQTLPDMLRTLKRRFAVRAGDTIVVDRGMADAPCLNAIRAEKLHYIVATRQTRRNEFLAEFESLAEFRELVRQPSPTNPHQRKSRVQVRAVERDGELYVLCLSEGRQAKDRAIRQKHQQRLLADLERLQRGAAAGRLDRDTIHQRLGRLQERYPRVFRYTDVEVHEQSCALTYSINRTRQELAEQLDGSYMLRTDRLDMDGEQAWRTYMLLTRVEAAFRDLKTPLAERPIFHQLEHRVEAHIFLCVLAYHLLVAIENTLRETDDHRSWATIREVLRTHQTLTTVLPTTNGKELHVRNASTPEPTHRAIYKSLAVPARIMRPRRTWHTAKTES